ncbi:MAG: hypothetical protein IH840_16130 [Candidatus Heimdallarchaeota archaeon]|nr:hypothetical protein [Candidatus Heimdallarchaeota archaeon]
MSEYAPDFDYNEYLNSRIKDEFSSILEKPLQERRVKMRSAELNKAIDGYFFSKKVTKISGS